MGRALGRASGVGTDFCALVQSKQLREWTRLLSWLDTSSALVGHSSGGPENKFWGLLGGPESGPVNLFVLFSTEIYGASYGSHLGVNYGSLLLEDSWSRLSVLGSLFGKDGSLLEENGPPPSRARSPTT